MASKPRTGLRTRPSAAKCLQELDFDVKKNLAPPKSIENHEKPEKNRKKKFQKKIRRQKIENCKSSETRVAEVSQQSERISRGKRTFEVRRRLGGIREA